MIEGPAGGPAARRTGSPATGALKLFGEHWKTLVPCALVGVIPVALLDAVDYAQSGVDPFMATTPAPEGGQTTLSWIALGLSLALYSLVSAACVRVVAEAVAERETDWRNAVSWGSGRTISVLVVTLLVTVGVAVALLALILPGIWLAIAWSVATPAVVLEGSSPLAALKRSFALVRGSWWHACGAIVVGLLIALAILIAVAIPLTLILTGIDDEPVRIVLYALIETVIMAILLPFGAALLTLLYFDLRARRERQTVSYLPPSGEGSFGGFEPPAAPR